MASKELTITPERFGALLISQASKFVGLREISPNRDWDNPTIKGYDKEIVTELTSMMRPSPWQPGWAYCAAFCEGIVITVSKNLNLFSNESIAKLAKLLSPGVLATFNNFKNANLVTLPNKNYIIPPGSIWLAQHGSSGNGHCGFVTSDEHPYQATIEANTSMDSSNPSKDREGDWITTRIAPKTGRGSLRTKGYITPIQLLSVLTQ